MKLDNPHSAILSAVIFNADHHRPAHPARAARREVPGDVGQRRPAPQPPDLRRRRHHRPVRRDQAHRPRRHRARSPLMIRRQLLTALIVIVVMTVMLGLRLPARRDRHRAGRVPQQGQRLAREGQRQGRRLVAARSELHRQGRQPAAAVLPAAAVGGRRRLRRELEQRVEPRAVEPEPHRQHPGRRASATKTNPYATPSRPVLRAGAGDRQGRQRHHRQGRQPRVREEQGRLVRLRPEHRARAGDRVPGAQRPRRRTSRCRSTRSPRRHRASTPTSRSPNADLQAQRVATARHLPLATVMAQIKAHTDGRSLGFLGEKAVNVLELNLGLDKLGH